MLARRILGLLVLSGLLGSPAVPAAPPCEPDAAGCCCPAGERGGPSLERACDCGCALAPAPAAPTPREPRRDVGSSQDVAAPPLSERAVQIPEPRAFHAPTRGVPAAESPPLFLLHRSLLL
ncbi:MAG: hypothetical protein L0323_05150 [Planctomycetes bacterium]|nr:hypothetical protein [Planctomycetota bacterium]